MGPLHSRDGHSLPAGACSRPSLNRNGQNLPDGAHRHLLRAVVCPAEMLVPSEGMLWPQAASWAAVPTGSAAVTAACPVEAAPRCRHRLRRRRAQRGAGREAGGPASSCAEPAHQQATYAKDFGATTPSTPRARTWWRGAQLPGTAGWTTPSTPSAARPHAADRGGHPAGGTAGDRGHGRLTCGRRSRLQHGAPGEVHSRHDVRLVRRTSIPEAVTSTLTAASGSSRRPHINRGHQRGSPARPPGRPAAGRLQLRTVAHGRPDCCCGRWAVAQPPPRRPHRGGRAARAGAGGR